MNRKINKSFTVTMVLALIFVLLGLTVKEKCRRIITSSHESVKMLTIIDDDGDAKYYTDIYPLAKSKGISISTAIPASFPGKKGYMTWDMIEECKENGMEILCHTYSHPLSKIIDEKNEDWFYADYEQAKDVFATHGLEAKYVVFSGSTGLYDKAQNSAHKLFLGGVLAGDNQINHSGYDRFRIKRFRIGSDYAWDGEVLKNLIDQLNAQGGWMVWMMHTSDRKRYTSEAPKALEMAIDYCKEKAIPIVTLDEGFMRSR